MNISDISDDKAAIKLSIDLVTAARRHLYFLQTVSESHFLYNSSSLLQAIRRYDELWMPLVSDLMVGTTLPLLPPLDVQWVWHCHTLNPKSYRRYCEKKFSKIIEKPVIYDDGNEEYALNRCFDAWSERYPFEPFELEHNPDEKEEEEIVANQVISTEVSKHKDLCSKFSAPYMWETVYLISAKQRYKGFMYLLQRFNEDGVSRLVPTLDIQLMWLTHQSYPMVYAEDVKGVEGDLEKVVGVWEQVEEGDVEGTKKLWEQVFDNQQPYERAGGVVVCLKPPVYWVVSDADVNTRYKSMRPRFLLEVCVFLTRKVELHPSRDKQNDYISLRPIRCHKEMKHDKTISSLPFDRWTKPWHLYCEFNTRGLILELRYRGSSCLKNNVRSTIVFLWNDLLRAPCLTFGKDLGKEVKAVVSITPPAQAPYLLKCVPDRVSDDSGAMISDEILKMNRYRPQEGRWLSRTVLDHTGKECFVMRIRVGGGIWRRGGETPQVVKWEDRIIEVREGCWTYVVGPIGKVPGAMISDEILKMNRYRPQEGRWLSRTVLDHTGKECFVMRIRVGGGIWRRGGETPQVVKWEDRIIEVREGCWTYVVGPIGKVPGSVGGGIWRRGGETPQVVKWEDRIIEVREGCWTYVVGPIGKVPEKVVGTATPKEPSKDKASWSLSTGDELTVHRVSSGLIFNLQSRTSTDSVRLLQGRKLQYQVSNEVVCKDEDKEHEEDAFVTLVRYTPGNPNGRATALINWRYLVVELQPEEDAVMVLLICMAILRSVSEMAGEDMGNLLARRRPREHKHGMRDWGSIVIHPTSSPAPNFLSSPFLQPWHWNAKAVMSPVEAVHILRYSPAEGGDDLYKRGVVSRSKGLAE